MMVAGTAPAIKKAGAMAGAVVVGVDSVAKAGEGAVWADPTGKDPKQGVTAVVTANKAPMQGSARPQVSTEGAGTGPPLLLQDSALQEQLAHGAHSSSQHRASTAAAIMWGHPL